MARSPTFLQTMLKPWQRYADFDGRSDRLELWAFSLLIVVAVTVVSVGFVVLAQQMELATERRSLLVAIATLVMCVFVLATLVPSLAVAVRRLHDQGRSGYYLLVLLLPLIGGLVLGLILMLPGQQRANRYGPPPGAGLEVP